MQTFTDHLTAMDQPQRKAFERIRTIVHEIAPQDIDEVITYAMPGFKYKGKYLLSIGTFKDHMSFFPGALPEDTVAKLGDFKMSKGTIQFTPEQPLPESIIKEILNARIAEIDSAEN